MILPRNAAYVDCCLDRWELLVASPIIWHWFTVRSQVSSRRRISAI
jgi:hypothetical protein